MLKCGNHVGEENMSSVDNQEDRPQMDGTNGKDVINLTNYSTHKEGDAWMPWNEHEGVHPIGE